MTHDEIVKYVEDLYACTGVGDFDTAETMLTDDFFVTEADSLPFAGVYRGKTALRELYTKVMSMMDVAGLNREITTTGKDTAVCLLSFEFADPALKPSHLAELFRFRDGKACEIKPHYFDPAKVTRATGLRVVDCSTMPGPVTGNTNTPAMALALRAAAPILEDRP